MSALPATASNGVSASGVFTPSSQKGQSLDQYKADQEKLRANGVQIGTMLTEHDDKYGKVMTIARMVYQQAGRHLGEGPDRSAKGKVELVFRTSPETTITASTISNALEALTYDTAQISNVVKVSLTAKPRSAPASRGTGNNQPVLLGPAMAAFITRQGVEGRFGFRIPGVASSGLLMDSMRIRTPVNGQYYSSRSVLLVMMHRYRAWQLTDGATPIPASGSQYNATEQHFQEAFSRPIATFIYRNADVMTSKNKPTNESILLELAVLGVGLPEGAPRPTAATSSISQIRGDPSASLAAIPLTSFTTIISENVAASNNFKAAKILVGNAVVENRMTPDAGRTYGVQYDGNLRDLASTAVRTQVIEDAVLLETEKKNLEQSEFARTGRTSKQAKKNPANDANKKIVKDRLVDLFKVASAAQFPGYAAPTEKSYYSSLNRAWTNGVKLISGNPKATGYGPEAMALLPSAALRGNILTVTRSQNGQTQTFPAVQDVFVLPNPPKKVASLGATTRFGTGMLRLKK